MLFIICLSIIFQFITVIISLRLIRITGYSRSWVLIALAIMLMGIRRCVALFWLLQGSTINTPDLVFEIVGLLTSALMMIGVSSIVPIFISIKQSEEVQKKLFEDLQASINNVKVLSGMLPICSSCKKIRDDQGYWTQIESYITDHSEAEFTHGICQDCVRKIYGITA